MCVTKVENEINVYGLQYVTTIRIVSGLVSARGRRHPYLLILYVTAYR